MSRKAQGGRWKWQLNRQMGGYDGKHMWDAGEDGLHAKKKALNMGVTGQGGKRG